MMLSGKFAGGGQLTVRAKRADGNVIEFPVTVRIDTPQEALYYKHGGILQYVLRQLVGKTGQSSAVSAPPRE
jgi:aconitate hydratase